ncbi:M66 family metalloprotease [Candidatus Symbiopectobacterium sp. NZEC151]|uniref:M66 family metalloprotease n=1 Tax=Candidatus Symbiopectobacterium sp. NZEC151 TaxID=2820470 RepID=UPI002226B912|nr:M66 family metalloprotease [Candidatus Symbiopectobacterium sp. NZEC151]MCW2473452.1 hypothetical protein [Candidatus Symbiopectobacterium sp. NZEC151]
MNNNHHHPCPPSPFNADTLVFNTNEGINDLTGSLQANVHFAQSQIIPATPRPDDTQPTLVENRRTLLMVRPAVIVNNLSVTVKDSSGSTLGPLSLNPPDSLPRPTPSGLSFTPPTGSHHIINTKEELLTLNDPTASHLSSLLQQYVSVRIRIADGLWVNNIYLPRNTNYGNMIIINSTAGQTTTVYYNGTSTFIFTGNEEKFIFFESRWLRENALYNENILYAQHTWSVTLPPQWIKPGVSMTFTSGNLTGDLQNIPVGAPTQLLLNTIDIGMLTPPRNEFTFTESPEFHREYFQTVPVSRMVVSAYQAVHLTEVMLPNGNFYTDRAPGMGDWHNGVLREDIGKGLISLGINFANYGLNSSEGSGHWHFVNSAQITVHNSVGKYENGVQIHGGSGGSGMATLDESVGNEFSHEVGHAYDLSHFPGGFDGSVHRPANTINSTWGWDAGYDIFLPNFRAQVDNAQSCVEGTCQLPFYGHSFGFDPMANGEPMSPFNSFTLHTPYTAKLVQTFLESKMVFSSTSPSGFRMWDPTTRTMVPHIHRVDIDKPFTAPNTDLSAPTLAAFLSNNAVLAIVLRDGDWTRDIHIPIAHLNNAGRVITIDDDAGFVSYLHINQAPPIEIHRGFQASYKSDGTLWNEIILLNQSQFRITVPMVNNEALNLQSYIADYTVVDIGIWDGHWTPTISVPPSSPDNNRKVIIIKHVATSSTELLINGLRRVVNGGDTLYYISNGNSWIQKPELVDLSVERAPYAFGVPVTTLIGYYDPQGILQPYIYPALHGAYGYIYNDNQEVSPSADWQLWVESSNQTLRFRLHNSRIESNIMNKFHINIPETNTPRAVSLVRNGVKILTKKIEPVSSSLQYTVNGA